MQNLVRKNKKQPSQNLLKKHPKYYKLLDLFEVN